MHTHTIFYVAKVDHSIFKGKSFIASNATAETVCIKCMVSLFPYIFHVCAFCIAFFRCFYFSRNAPSTHGPNTFYNQKSYFSTIIDNGSSIFCLFIFSRFSRMHERKMLQHVQLYIELQLHIISLQKKIQWKRNAATLLHFLVAYLSFPSQNEWLTFKCCAAQLQRIQIIHIWATFLRVAWHQLHHGLISVRLVLRLVKWHIMYRRRRTCYCICTRAYPVDWLLSFSHNHNQNHIVCISPQICQSPAFFRASGYWNDLHHSLWKYKLRQKLD